MSTTKISDSQVLLPVIPLQNLAWNHADNDNDAEEKPSCSRIELLQVLGHLSVMEKSKRAMSRARPSRAPQTAQERELLQVEYDDALATVNRIEANVGPALEKTLRKAKRFQAVYGLDRERRETIKRRFGQRKGLLRLMHLEFHSDFPDQVTDRSLRYVEHMMKISANVAAFTGSGWSSTLSWFESRLPLLTMQLTPDRLHADFDRYLADARAELAARIPSGCDALHTGPSPAAIAEDLKITTAQLRYANANRCGLTSIDPEDRKTRDRNRKDRMRREQNMKRQSERTRTAELATLAERLGCSLRTVQRHAKAGTLETLVASRTSDVTKVSPKLGSLNSGQISDTSFAPAGNDNLHPVEALALSETGFTGRYVTFTPWQVQAAIERHPNLAADLKTHLDAIDGLMRKTTQPYWRVVMRNLLKERSRAVGRAMKKAENATMAAAA